MEKNKSSSICHNLFSNPSHAYFSDLPVYSPSRQLCSSAATRILRIPMVKKQNKKHLWPTLFLVLRSIAMELSPFWHPSRSDFPCLQARDKNSPLQKARPFSMRTLNKNRTNESASVRSGVRGTQHVCILFVMCYIFFLISYRVVCSLLSISYGGIEMSAITIMYYFITISTVLGIWKSSNVFMHHNWMSPHNKVFQCLHVSMLGASLREYWT